MIRTLFLAPVVAFGLLLTGCVQAEPDVSQYDLYKLCKKIEANAWAVEMNLHTMQLLHPEAGIAVSNVSPNFCRDFWPNGVLPPVWEGPTNEDNE